MAYFQGRSVNFPGSTWGDVLDLRDLSDALTVIISPTFKPKIQEDFKAASAKLAGLFKVGE